MTPELTLAAEIAKLRNIPLIYADRPSEVSFLLSLQDFF